MITSPLLLIAHRELLITIRNRWTLIVALVFGVLMLAIAWAGVATEGYDGMSDFTRTSASMVNLILYVVPLMALVLATLSFAGDRGTTELLFSQPVSRTEVMLGKIAGLFVAMGGAMSVGFLVSGSVVLFATGTDGVGGFIAFALMTLLLALIFLCIAALATMLAGRRPRSFGFAILLWFHFALFYDLVVLGIASQLRGQTAVTALFFALFGNPVDLIRVASLIVLDNETIFGASGAALLRFLGGTEVSIMVLVAAAVAWVGLPLVWAHRLLRSQDI